MFSFNPDANTSIDDSQELHTDVDALITESQELISNLHTAFEEEAGGEDETPFPELYGTIAGPLGTVGNHGDNEGRVQTLLAEGHAVNERTRDQGWTPVMVSGSTGQPNIMRILLRHGADIDERDSQGNSALDWTLHRARGFPDDIVFSMALHSGHEACAELLRTAAQPWSPATHDLFPHAQRRMAAHILRVGYALSRRPAAASIESTESEEPSCSRSEALGQLSQGFLDAWISVVMPLVIERQRPPELPPTGEGLRCALETIAVAAAALPSNSGEVSTPSSLMPPSSVLPPPPSRTLPPLLESHLAASAESKTPSLEQQPERTEPAESASSERAPPPTVDAHMDARREGWAGEALAEAVVASVLVDCEDEDDEGEGARMGQDAPRQLGAVQEHELAYRWQPSAPSDQGTPSVLLSLASAVLAAQGHRPSFAEYAAVPPEHPFDSSSSHE